MAVTNEQINAPANTQNIFGTGIANTGTGSLVTTAPPLYAGLNAQSTPEEIAAAYQQAIQGAGGDTQANQTQAIDYLTGIAGISQPNIAKGYELYKNPVVSQDVTQGVTQADTLTAPVFDPKLGVFQKVYDPRTGQEFISPAQAFTSGVTDYVTEMPMKLEFLNETGKKAVTDAMAGGATFEQALDRLGAKFGMSGKDFYNYEVQSGIRSNNTLPIRQAVANESGGLKPAELVAKLQAYKDKPPTTAQEFREQQALYADYARRYADSSWDYANMGGVAQDYSLKPQDYLKTQFTGYSDPLNKFLSGMNQNTPTFQKVREQLTGNPEIVKAIEDIYKSDPKHHLFTGSAGNLEGVIHNLAGNISQIGKSAALKNFYRDQQNLVGFGGDNWFGGQNMGTPQWAELQRTIMDLTPVASEDKWQDTALRTSGKQNIKELVRDPYTKMGVGLISDESTGYHQGIGYYDRNGQLLRTSLLRPEDILKNAEEFGLDTSGTSALGRILKTAKVDINPAEMASPEWLESQIKHLDWQNSNAIFSSPLTTQTRLQEIRQTNDMAKRMLARPTAEGILSAFKDAKDSGLSEDDMKKTLGEDAYKTYKSEFSRYAKTGIAGILADGQLSFDEARDATKFGRDYGYNSQQLADLTGQKKEVFDTIQQKYDEMSNSVIDKVLEADDVKTADDKILRALALEREFGFNDEDFAKATGFDLSEIKSTLDPVRNFETDYQKLSNNTDTTTAGLKKFVEDARSNGVISRMYGDGLNGLDAKIAGLEDKWKDYKGVDPLRAERINSQIETQRNALGDQYYKGVFGDPKTMASTLAKKGVGSLADLGEKEKFRPATAQAQYTANGVPVQSSDGKNFYRTVNYGENETYSVPVDAKDVQTTYGKYVTEGDGENSYSVFEPLSEQEQATLKDGKYQERLGTVVINKKTGEELTDTSHALAYQRSSGGLKEKKNYLAIKFDKNGNAVPVAYNEKAGLGAAVQQALPIIAMALPFILPGVGAALSGMLPGAAVAASGATAAIPATLMNQALTQGIISGGLTTLGGGQFEKGFLGGAVSPVISSGISSLLPTGMDPNAARAITGAGTGVVKGALEGGDFGDLLGQGVLSGLANYGLGEATKGFNLTPQQLNFATGIALPLLQGEKVNPLKVFGTATNYLASQQNQGKTP